MNRLGLIRKKSVQKSVKCVQNTVAAQRDDMEMGAFNWMHADTSLYKLSQVIHFAIKIASRFILL